MKRIGNLYKQIADKANLIEAHRNARKGKRQYYSVSKVDRHLDNYIDRLQKMLMDHSFHTAKYTVFRITEPKERFIYRLPYYPDRIVHHAIMQVCQPVWDKVFIHDSYAAIPGKGIHAGLARLKSFLQDDAGTRYCFKMDVKKFYPSIDHDVLSEIVRRKIKCKETLALIDDIIYSANGLPIGNYLSQYLSNLYLNEFDHWMKEQRRCRYYIRYCDDAVVLHRDKKFLKDLWKAVEEYLNRKLSLQLNTKSQVFPVESRGVDFLGYKTYHRFSLLRKSSKTKFVRKIKAISSGSVTDATHIVSSLMSYVGWMKHCNSYNLVNKHITSNPQLIRIVQDACKQLNIANPLSTQEV